MINIKGKYTEANIYAKMCENEAMNQIFGLCNHPAFEDSKIRVMPDVHAGKGCTVGTTIQISKDMVIPNIVGVDIGCGVLGTVFKSKKQIDTKGLNDFIVSNVPSGFNVRKTVHKDVENIVITMVDEICNNLNFKNKEYFFKSIGSLGGGNHFIEIDKIDSETYILFVHTGSRNLGKKVCEYFQVLAEEEYSKKQIFEEKKNELIKQLVKENKQGDIAKKLKELKESLSVNKNYSKELAFISGNNFSNYMKNMKYCQAMAKENRRIISKDIIDFLEVEVVETFDTIHNYIEEINENGVKKYIIRKGAVSAKKGEKLSIPLNMKDGTIIASGKGNSEWNFSAPHGAGRILSRSKAKKELSMKDFSEDMKNIDTWSVCMETIDEAPKAYKPAEDIIEIISETADILYIAKPIYNFKAH